MEQNRVRIVDIAEELGVSTATVSNVIHGKTKKNFKGNRKTGAGAFGTKAVYSEYGWNFTGTK